jgi:hypothetical protein
MLLMRIVAGLQGGQRLHMAEQSSSGIRSLKQPDAVSGSSIIVRLEQAVSEQGQELASLSSRVVRNQTTLDGGRVAPRGPTQERYRLGRTNDVRLI